MKLELVNVYSKNWKFKRCYYVSARWAATKPPGHIWHSGTEVHKLMTR